MTMKPHRQSQGYGELLKSLSPKTLTWSYSEISKILYSPFAIEATHSPTTSRFSFIAYGEVESSILGREGIKCNK